MSTIRLNEALAIMETGNIFSVKYVTFDKKRKSGGKIKFYPQVRVLKKTKTTEPKTTTSPQFKSKNPNHWGNGTRPIKVVVDGIEAAGNKKLHVFLMLEFNNKRVVL